jgi:hypothetical protein
MASALPRSRSGKVCTLLLVPGMGHDMPPALADRFVAELTAHFATAEP